VKEPTFTTKNLEEIARNQNTMVVRSALSSIHNNKVNKTKKSPAKKDTPHSKKRPAKSSPGVGHSIKKPKMGANGGHNTPLSAKYDLYLLSVIRIKFLLNIYQCTSNFQSKRDAGQEESFL